MEYSERIVQIALYDAHDKGRLKRGADALFAQVNEAIGVKCFYSRGEAVDNQKFQYFASLHRLAPRCLHQILPVAQPNNGKQMWGFLTEIADVSPFQSKSLMYQDELANANPEVRELHKRLRYAGFKKAIDDLHSYNVGYYNGSLVCIDFSRMTSYGFQSRYVVRTKYENAA